MTIRKLRAGRVATVTAAEWVGEVGTLFYDESSGLMRIADGVTPGGSFVPVNPATDTIIGGIIAGPGANVSPTGLLTIDTTGLPLGIGNLSIANTSISTTTADWDLNLVTNGVADINLVGNVHFHRRDVWPEDGKFFEANSGTGIVRVTVTSVGTEGAFNIIGSTTGTEVSPGLTGTMMHITGQRETPNRIYYDGNGDYVSWVARRWNGSIADGRTQVLAGDDVLRINSTVQDNTGMGSTAMAQIRTTALENQTSTAQGSSITFTVTPIGSAPSARVDVANVTAAYGVWATKFTTTGNVTAGNIVAGIGTYSGNITAGNISTTQVNTAGAIISAGGIYDNLGALRSIPQNSKNTGYTLQATDNGQMINITTGNVTVPAGVFNTTFGQTVSIYNNQNFSNTIVQGSGVTMRLAGTAATGNRTIARYGVATIVCVAANTFVISGAGIT